MKDRRYVHSWLFPLEGTHEVPTLPHLGAFAAVRKFHTHEGVDLYASEGTSVYAVEPGLVVVVEPFTGPLAGSPWWHDTMCVMVEGASGVVVYGEITPSVQIGQTVGVEDVIGQIKQVLIKDKGRPMSMLHLELHSPGTRETFPWEVGGTKPLTLQDPTSLLETSIVRK